MGEDASTRADAHSPIAVALLVLRRTMYNVHMSYNVRSESILLGLTVMHATVHAVYGRLQMHEILKSATITARRPFTCNLGL